MSDDPFFIDRVGLDPSSMTYWRAEAPDGRVVEVIPLTFGRARICIGDGVTTYDDGW